MASSPCSDLLPHALRLLRLGYSVLPLRGKVPAVSWSEYQQRKPGERELHRWARRGLFQNLGIVCGAVSGNLVVLDFDQPDAYHAFCADHPALARTLTVATGGGGWHLYLRVEQLPPSRRLPGLDLCAGGRQVVAPPSIHPTTGQPYRVLIRTPILRLPALELAAPAARSAPPERATSSLDGAISTLADYFRAQGYRPNGDWLNGPCIYPERHAHGDTKRSFGFNTRTGYGYCFRCGSMTTKEIGERAGTSSAAGHPTTSR